jgi:hypothetical protein
VRVAIFVAVVAAHLALLWLFTSLHRWVLLPAEDEAAITPIFLPPLPPEIAVEPIWEPPEWGFQVQAQVPEPTQRPVKQESQQELTRARLPTSDTLAPSDTRAAAVPGPTAEPQVSPALQANPTLQANTALPANAALAANAALQANMPPQLSPDFGPPQPSELTSGAPDWRAAAAATAQTDAQHIVEAEDDAARKVAALTARFKPLPGPRVRGPEFAWDYAHTHRLTPLQGGGFVIALNDRCAIAILPLPMFGCAVGRKSPANGDLFKFMHPPVKFGDWDWRLDDP